MYNYDSDIVCRLSQFQLVTEDTLHEVIMKCPSKSCSLDPMPTWLVKQHLPVLTPILTKIVNSSLSSGSLPSGLRRAIITPILKKASLDKNTLGNYRPVSNLPFVGKLIEKVVSAQVSDYISSNGLSDLYQSAYTKARSTETALACVQNDILRAINNQQAVFLLMLDLSAAFDTVDHGILLERLAGDFGFTGDVHNWYKTSLEARTCSVIINGDFSSDKHLIYGVPQVRLLGPRLSPTILAEWVTLFTNMVSSITYMRTMFKFIPFLTQIVLVMLYVPCFIYLAVSRVYRFGCLIIGWSWIKRKLNFLLLHLPTITVPCNFSLQHLTLNLDGNEIPSSPSIRNLGVIFDYSMTMAEHITNLSRSINWQLRNLNRIRKFLDTDTCHNIVRTLILSKLNYCNSL